MEVIWKLNYSLDRERQRKEPLCDCYDPQSPSQAEQAQSFVPVLDVWHSLTERCFVSWLQIPQASIEVVKVSRGKARNRLLCTGALVIQLMGGNWCTVKRGWVWQRFGQEGNWRIFPWLNHAVNPWACSCPQPRQAVSRCIIMQFTNLQIFTALIKFIMFTMNSRKKEFSIDQGEIHFIARKSNRKPVCCICKLPPLFPTKKKFEVLILFMKTPKIFSKVMGEYQCVLYDPGGLEFSGLFFYHHLSFRYCLSWNQILRGNFNKSNIDSHFCETRSYLYGQDAGAGAQRILLVWMETKCQEDWSCHLLECATNDNCHAKILNSKH